MKSSNVQFRNLILSVTIFGLLQVPYGAQTATTSKTTAKAIVSEDKNLKADDLAAVSEAERTRSIRIRKEVEAKKVDGLIVGVYQVKDLYDLNPLPVNPFDIFQSGDLLRISLVSNFDGYVYVLNKEQGGNQYLSFPSRLAKNNDNKLKAGITKIIPPENTLEFDAAKGTEILQVIVSKTRIRYFDEGLKNWGEESKIPESEKDFDLTGDDDENTRGINIKSKVPLPIKSKILARKIELAPPDQVTKDAVIAIQKEDNHSNGRMNSRPVVFEIRLQHN